MFGDLLKNLLAPQPKPLDKTDGQRALAALMVRLARSDGDYAAEEIAWIDRLLANRFGLSPFEASALRQDAETLESEAPDTVRFTRAIKDTVPYEDRLGVIESLWQIALADGERDYEEDSLLRLVSSLLGISDVDNARARQRVAARN